MINLTTEDGRLGFDPAPIVEEIAREIRTIKGFSDPPQQIEYSQEQAAKILGISQSHLSSLCSEGRGPRFRCVGGRRKYFSHHDLEEWVGSHRRYQSMNEYYAEHPELRPNIEELSDLGGMD